MNRLQAELRRLYSRQDDGRVRTLVLELAAPGSWERLSGAWRGVQADLHLPAPGIAVSGVDSIQLWFSMEDPVPAAEAAEFLPALCRRYLEGVAAERVRLDPPQPGMPPRETAPGRWSAFVAADLASLFTDEPWVDMPPSADAQAELLAGLHAIKTADFRRALEQLRPAPGAESAAAPQDPRRFLLGVMNDPAVDLHLRIEAAKALLPYTEGPRGA
jgi:hypothetical protein